MLKKFKLDNQYGLIIASIIVLYICYQLAFKKTIEAWQQHQLLRHQIVQSGDVSYNPVYTARKGHNLDKILSLYKVDTANLRSDILTTISSIAEKNNVKLAGVPTEDPNFHTNNFIIQKLDFEGDYFSLVKTLRDLQTTAGIGIIRSVSLKSIRSISANGELKKTTMNVQLESAIQKIQ